jgi:hypothetical protein
MVGLSGGGADDEEVPDGAGIVGDEGFDFFTGGVLVDRPIKTITNNPFGLSLSKANIGRQ